MWIIEFPFCFVPFFRDHIEWNQISNNVKPGGNFVVLDLEPATWYNVRITAHNSAGFTVAEYEFATLTVTGGIFKSIDCLERCHRENKRHNGSILRYSTDIARERKGENDYFNHLFRFEVWWLMLDLVEHFLK